ncbi:MAG: hypothetical protein H7338_04170 [Candidatus Sericytochromatia bacterium]|nr:hypothetical protein [Candidatus Sericytochromatia bacterium]
MDEREVKNQIPCVIESGVLTNYRDMQRILRDLGHVRYAEVVDGDVRHEGEGYVMSVVSNGHSATVVAHKRLYLNVNGFEYLRLAPIDHQSTAFELVDSCRTLRLIPQVDPIAECLADDDIVEAARLLEDPLDTDLYAEIYADDDDAVDGGVA